MGTGGVTDWQHVYFGQYDSTADGVDNPQPLYWRVLDTDQTSQGGDGVFLLSEHILDSKKFNDNNTTTWAGSIAEAWCQSFTAGSNFSALEGSAITNGAFFLSSTEAQSANYFLNGNVVAGASSRSAGTVGNPSSFAGWWLRSPSGSSGDLVMSGVQGSGMMSNCRADYANGIRPAINLNMARILFSTAADQEKTAFGTAQAYTGDAWRFTLKDDHSMANGASLAEGRTLLPSNYDAETYTVSHAALSSFADAGYTNVTAALTDASGSLLYYGSINQSMDATSSSVTLPVGLPAGTYTLCFYGEQLNGAYNTDMATGTPFTVPITVEDKASYTITTSADANGSISPSGTVAVTEGTNPTFTFTPNSGYRISEVLVDAVNIGTPTSYTFTNVTGNHSIEVRYEEIPVVPDETFTVTFDSRGGSTASAISGIQPGGKITAPADPTRSGYTFTGWFTDSACTNLWRFDRDIVNRDMTLYAGWEANEPTPTLVPSNPPTNAGPTTPSKDIPQTGDTPLNGLWCLLAAASLVLGAAAFVVRKKRTEP